MKKRALLISPLVPGITGNGLSMRAGVWLECLSHDFDVDLVVLPLYPAHPSSPDFVRSLASTVSIFNPVRAELDPARFTLAEKDVLALNQLRESSDLIVVFRHITAELVMSELSTLRIPGILDLDDAEWIHEERLGNQNYSDHLARRIRATSEGFSLVTFAAPVETIASLEQVVGTQAMTIPNVSREPQEHSGMARREKIDLLFVGTLGYSPNEEGLLWFINQVMPLLSDVTLTIVGTNPTPALREKASSRVHIFDNVVEVSSWYNSARVAIVPLFAGSGTRTKILEAWAHQIPVITTTIGIEGITNTKGAVVADSVEDFAQACKKLLSDSDLRNKLGEAGHAQWQDHYGLDSAQHHISLAVDRALSP